MELGICAHMGIIALHLETFCLCPTSHHRSVGFITACVGYVVDRATLGQVFLQSLTLYNVRN